MILTLVGAGAFAAGLYKVANTPQVSKMDLTAWRRDNGQQMPEVRRSVATRCFLTLRLNNSTFSFMTQQPEGYVDASDVVVVNNRQQQPLASVAELPLLPNRGRVPGSVILGFAPAGVPSKSAYNITVHDGANSWRIDLAYPRKLTIGFVTEQKLVGKKWQPQTVQPLKALEYWVDGDNFEEFAKAENVPGDVLLVNGVHSLNTFLKRHVTLGRSAFPFKDASHSLVRLFSDSVDSQYKKVYYKQEGDTIRVVYVLFKFNGAELPYNSVL